MLSFLTCVPFESTLTPSVCVVSVIIVLFYTGTIHLRLIFFLICQFSVCTWMTTISAYLQQFLGCFSRLCYINSPFDQISPGDSGSSSATE